MIIATGQPITAALLRGIYGVDWDTWTPTFTGGGAATFSASGRWRRIGERSVAFTVNWTIGTTGTGTGTLSWTLPTAPARSRRWIFVGAQEGGTPKSGLHSVTFTGGSGTLVDRVRYAGASNIIGTDLVSGMQFQFSGVYEEA